MITFNEPQDILGLGIKNILSFRQDNEKYQQLISTVNKTIVVEFRDIYAVTVVFHDNTITIDYDEADHYDLKVILDINMMGDIALGKEGPIRGFLKGKLQVKKLWNIGLLLKFIQIFIPNLKMAGERAKNVKKSA